MVAPLFRGIPRRSAHRHRAPVRRAAANANPTRRQSDRPGDACGIPRHPRPIRSASPECRRATVRIGGVSRRTGQADRRSVLATLVPMPGPRGERRSSKPRHCEARQQETRSMRICSTKAFFQRRIAAFSMRTGVASYIKTILIHIVNEFFGDEFLLGTLFAERKARIAGRAKKPPSGKCLSGHPAIHSIRQGAKHE